eukprot:gene11001-12164_t
MDSGLMLQPENNSRFGFKNSPVTKILLIASGAATLNLLFLPGNYHRIIDLNWPLITSKQEVWRLLTSQLVYDSTAEWLYGSALLYHLRHLERQWGSKKFAVSGVVYEHNLFYVQKWLCVPDFISSLARTVYNWFVINDDTKPRHRKVFAGATEEIHEDMMYDYLLRMQTSRTGANRQMGQGYTDTLQPDIDPVEGFLDAFRAQGNLGPLLGASCSDLTQFIAIKGLAYPPGHQREGDEEATPVCFAFEGVWRRQIEMEETSIRPNAVYYRKWPRSAIQSSKMEKNLTKKQRHLGYGSEDRWENDRNGGDRNEVKPNAVYYLKRLHVATRLSKLEKNEIKKERHLISKGGKERREGVRERENG